MKEQGNKLIILSKSQLICQEGLGKEWMCRIRLSQYSVDLCFNLTSSVSFNNISGLRLAFFMSVPKNEQT